MSDFLIRKISNNQVGGKYSAPTTEYEKLRRDYEKFMKQAEKSDMLNSLTFRQKQLEMLQKLRAAAINDSNYGDFELIDDDIAFLEAVIPLQEKQAKEQELRDYVPPVLPVKPKNDLLSLLNACKNLNGEIDNETRRIVLAFDGSDVSPKGLSRLVDKCRGIGEIIPIETVKSIEKLREAGVSPNLIFEAVDASPVLIDSEVGKIDFSWVDDMLTYKSMGVSELESLKFSKKLNADYENKDKVFSSVLKMMESGFDADMTAEIISTFSIANKETGKRTLSVKSVNSVLGMKKTLSSSHSVERNERQNPINQQGVVLFQLPTADSLINEKLLKYGDSEENQEQMLRNIAISSNIPFEKFEEAIRMNEALPEESRKPFAQVLKQVLDNSITAYNGDVIVMKDGKVVDYIKQKEKKQQDLLKLYSDSAAIIENNIISDFVKAYKTKDGNLDQNALRVFTVLRGAGVSYEHILPLVDAALNVIPTDKKSGVEKHYEIDADKVNTMTTLKKAGALSSDILTILASLTKDENGKYSDSDIKNACYLTQLIIPGREVVELLPEVSKDLQVKDFVTDFSSIIDDKRFMLPLVQLTKDMDGKFHYNSAEVLYSLSERFLLNEKENMSESTFVSFARNVVEKSKSPVPTHVDDALLDRKLAGEELIIFDDDETVMGNVDENCLNVCIAMCRNNETPENILKALEICRDEYGYPNESLCDIIWDMSKQNACFSDIVDLINLCKPIDNVLDLERASVVADLLDNNYSVNEVMNFARDLGHN